MPTVKLDSPVNLLYGIGPEAERKLNSLGVFTIYDLITYLPWRYNDWSEIVQLGNYSDNTDISFIAVIATEPRRAGFKRTSPVIFRLSDGGGSIEAVFFNSPYILNQYKRGDRCFCHGTIRFFNGKFQLNNPSIEKISEEGTIKGNLIRPVYHLTNGITSNQIAKWVKTALSLIGNQLLNVIPDSIASESNLPNEEEAYRMVHFPGSMEEAARGLLRLKYDELILLGIGIKRLNAVQKLKQAPVIIDAAKLSGNAEMNDKWNLIRKNLGFELTDDQKKAIKDIQSDLMQSSPMNRLVQGDVGSGKTAVALLVMGMTALMGHQSVLLAPTSVLASQHYAEALKLLEGTGIRAELLIGKTAASEKRRIKAGIASGEVMMVIGTHAVLTDDIVFNKLSLVITDEQHRFGVQQREKLLTGNGEANSIHSLVMTATPIPRTLGMCVYGDMDTSIIRQKPAGRMRIITSTVDQRDDKSIMFFIREKLENNEQIYIVCSRVDSEDKNEKVRFDGYNDSDAYSLGGYYEDGYLYSDDIQDENNEQYVPVGVKQMYEKLSLYGITDKYTTAVLYGSMKENEKLSLMERYINGDIKILISTTVIEVGVNNPNATIMMIMDADRYGLSTLHQLRGRVGRGKKQSYCVLANMDVGRQARERLNFMCDTEDGFELAEKDLELRGPGDFFGTKQHGIPELRAANLFTDSELASRVCEAVSRIVENESDEAERLSHNIDIMFKYRFGDKMSTL
ncbi:MAG: ATP-dependent DNA helicase RecG [Clostridia bacterium]|nr:ATP-dependent DNA helicase RecG [Clostridia bacterium]